MIYAITTFEKVDRNAGHWIKYGSQAHSRLLL